MMTPRMPTSPIYRLNIPELSGGINYRDGISLIHDNQMSDARNVWYKDGLLRTRPGARCITADELIEHYQQTQGAAISAEQVYAYPHIVSYVEYGEYHDRIATHLVATVTHIGITFIWVSADGMVQDLFCTIPNSAYPHDKNPHINVVQYKDSIYCFVSGYYPDDKNAPYFIFRIAHDEQQGWRYQRVYDDINGNDIYVPTVATNCLPYQGGTEEMEEANIQGDMVEGYNLVGNYYKVIYSTSREDSEITYMRYILPNNLNESAQLYGLKVHAEITDVNGNVYKHTVTLTEAPTISEEAYDIEESPQGDGLYMGVRKNMVAFFREDGLDRKFPAELSKNDYLRNNMVITAPHIVTELDVRKVTDMTFNEWFGGGAQGIYGGLHLFMGGNTNEKEHSLVIWSDFNKPLYFSENAFAYVGNTAQRVTAFGKQGEALVIFKELETYATQYTSLDQAMSAESVINQQIIDVAASEVTFPMIQIHGSIGCDCPNTVQMCRNRLVWAHSSGKVYTLTSANQWSERSIFEISAMVEPMLRKCSLRSAVSADWEGHYVLYTREHMFVMDYNTYGYTHVASYSKDEDAQSLIPWWVWDLPEESPELGAMMTLGGDKLLAVSLLSSGGTALWPELMLFDGIEDSVPYVYPGRPHEISTRPVASMAQTKLFDFGGATVKKSVPKVEISFGANGGVPIHVTTITDGGESTENVTLYGDETAERLPRFFTGAVIRNAVRNVFRVGYRVECSGALYIDAMSIFYKQIGGVR